MDKQMNERSFELRSEKVRSIMGQIPSSLLRYGMSIIGGVLLCIFAIAYYLPYRQVYSGVAIAQGKIIDHHTDSVDISMLLRFSDKRLTSAEGLHLSLFDQDQEITQGQLLKLSPRRDTLERQKALCRLSTEDWRLIENHTVDFRITVSLGSPLSQILDLWLPTP